MAVLRTQLLQQHLKPERQFRLFRPQVGSQPLADRFRDLFAGLRINPIGAFGDSVGHFGSVSLRCARGLSPEAVNCFGDMAYRVQYLQARG